MAIEWILPCCSPHTHKLPAAEPPRLRVAPAVNLENPWLLSLIKCHSGQFYTRGGVVQARKIRRLVESMRRRK